MSNRAERRAQGRRMSKKERLAKQAQDRARANRRHVDDPDYNEPIQPNPDPDGKIRFTDVFKPAKESDLGREDAEVFRRSKAIKTPDSVDQEEDEDEDYDDSELEGREEEEEEEDETYKHKETGQRPGSKLSKSQRALIHQGTGRGRGQGRSRARVTDSEDQDQSTLELESGRDFFSERAGETFAYLAGFTRYKIPMDDGTFLKVYRIHPPKYDIEEFKDMLARYQSGLDERGKAFKSAWHARLSEIALEDRKYFMLLREVGTDKPIKRVDILHAKDAAVPEAVVETALAAALSRWVEGKKLETITNQDR